MIYGVFYSSSKAVSFTLTLSLSEAGLLFNEEVKPPPKKGIQKSELND